MRAAKNFLNAQRQAPALATAIALWLGLSFGYAPSEVRSLIFIAIGCAASWLLLLRTHPAARLYYPAQSRFVVWLTLAVSCGFLLADHSRRSLYTPLPTEQEQIHAVVFQEPHSNARRLRIPLRILASNDTSLAQRQILFYHYNTDEERAPIPRIGDTLLLEECTLKPLAAQTRKSYRHYLISEQCAASVSARHWDRLPLSRPTTLRQHAAHVRYRLMERLMQAPLSPEVKSLVGAMTLGWRSDTEEIAGDFRAAGVSHLLAVSGFHLFVIAWFLGLLLRPVERYFPRRWIADLVVIGAVWSFALITGFAPPSVRAAGMLTLFLLAKLLYRPGNSLNGVGIAAIVSLLLAPQLFYSISFRLSYMAVCSIILFYPILRHLYRQITQPILRYILDSTAICLAAQPLVVPLVFYHFEEVSFAFLLSNLPLVILASLLIPLSLLWLLLSPTWLGGLLIVFVNGIAQMILDITQWTATLEWFSIRHPLSMWAVLIYYRIIVGISLLFRRRLKAPSLHVTY